MTVELAYQATGEGPPVVILHGLLGSARNFATIARQLGETHRVFCLDLRNHGESPWAEGMGYGEMALDVAAFLERHDLPSAAVIGHSMGGKVAMRLALGHPQRVARLIAVDIAPVAYGHTFAGYLEAMAGLDLAATTRRADFDAAMAAAVPEPGVRAFLLQNLVRSGAGFAWRVNLAALRANLAAIMGAPDDGTAPPYQGPTLFLAGGRSPYVQAEHRPAIERLFPRVELVTIEAAGHWVHAERPAEFLAAVRRFLGPP
jgi:pimeloyl-ACP methyl ester carboxylesterase